MGIKFKHVIKGTGDKQLKILVDLIRALKPEEYYRVFVLDLKKARSTSQNRYLWFCYSVIAEHTGIDSEDLHELCKQMFNLKTAMLNGTLIEFPGTTKMLDTKDMTVYIDKVRRWALDELGCYIPQANEIPEDEILKLINKGY